MKRHRVLIVEDDRDMANELAEIIRSLDFDHVCVDNKDDALVLIRESEFCLILLDLQIKGTPDAIKGHLGHGSALLREIRKLHPDHPSDTYWLPILVVSGFAREVQEGVAVMKDGASDVLQKPVSARVVVDAISSALLRSGRKNHGLCGTIPSGRPETEDSITLSITGEREGRRTRVLIGSRKILLPNAQLKTLIRLIVARMEGSAVHKTALGFKAHEGFKGISVLRLALEPALPDNFDMFDNDYHGSYRLNDRIRIGECNTGSLLDTGDSVITELAEHLRRALEANNQKV